MFIKGGKKPANSGRKKGVKNKARVLKVDEILLQQDINPVEEILKLVQKLPPDYAVRTWMELQKFIQAPAKESQPVTPSIPEPIEPISEDPNELLKIVNGNQSR